jgi:hypothetical protein
MGSKKQIGKDRRAWETRIVRPCEAVKVVKGYATGAINSGDGSLRSPVARSAIASAGNWVRDHEIIYSVDTDLRDQLLRSGLPEDEIPSDVFRRLPHGTPMFVLNEPILVPHGDDLFAYGQFIAIYMNERTGWIDVDATNAEYIRLLWFGINKQWIDNGKVNPDWPAGAIDTMVTSQSISLDEPMINMNELLSELVSTAPIVEEGDNFANRILVDDGDGWANTTKSLFAVGVMLTMYACSDEPDLIDVTPPASLRANGKFKGSNLEIHDLGIRIGAALRTHRTASGNATGTGNPVTPHVRRAHWHRFWTGPRDGERTLVLRWLPPIPVNLHKGKIISTVRPMKVSA